jgi:hypothetical protein
MKVVATLAKLFSSRKLIVEFTSNNIRLPRKSSKFGGIPYKYISYENIIRPKTKRQLGETTIASKAGSNKRNMVIRIHKKKSSCVLSTPKYFLTLHFPHSYLPFSNTISPLF